ncbi:hypothetical protein ACLKA6_000682 [Drosophila palustris]
MYQQQGRLYKWQPEWNSRGRGRGGGCGYGGWRQFGPPPTHLCPCACHKACGKCCLGWEAAPPTTNTFAAAPAVNTAPAAAPPGWVRVNDLRGLGLAPMQIQPVAEPAQAPMQPMAPVQPMAPMQPMAQPIPPPPPGWIQLDADGNVPSA